MSSVKWNSAVVEQKHPQTMCLKKNGYGCVPTKFYLQKQVVAQIWHLGHSLLTLGLEYKLCECLFFPIILSKNRTSYEVMGVQCCSLNTCWINCLRYWLSLLWEDQYIAASVSKSTSLSRNKMAFCKYVLKSIIIAKHKPSKQTYLCSHCVPLKIYLMPLNLGLLFYKIGVILSNFSSCCEY